MLKKCKVLVILFLISGASMAQDYSNPGSYMQFFSDQYKSVSKDLWDYMSSISRGQSARRVENRRKSLMNSLLDARKKIAATDGYRGDTGLRDSTLAYLTMNYSILKEDYEKIVNIEEIAGNSYDNMEAYVSIRRNANLKMSYASSSLNYEQRRFAMAHHINIIDDESKLSKKIDRAGDAFDYYDKMYLLLFKSQIREINLIESQNQEDLGAMEENKDDLRRYSNEGMAMLADVKPFATDSLLLNTCTSLMLFYKNEAEEMAPFIIDFFKKKETFDKLKLAIDAKGQSAAREDIDNYNARLKDYNDLINKYNQINNQMNLDRMIKTKAWNEAVKVFLDKQAR